MKVARQFTAWNAFTKKGRTVGHGLSWSTDGFAIQVENVPSHPIIPFPTGLVGLFKRGADLVKRMNGRALCKHRSANADVVACGLERLGSRERFGPLDSGGR